MSDIQRLLDTAGINPEAAPKLLLIAATYLRDADLLPANLAAYLATAFERTASKPQTERAKTLTESLGLDVPGRPRKSIDKFDVALTVAEHGAEETKLGMRVELAETYGVSKNTAKARIREAREKLGEARKNVGKIRVRTRGGKD